MPRIWRWPDDYVPLDGGRLLVRPDAAETFRSRGWTTCNAVLDADDVDLIRKVGTRDNCRLSLPLADSGVTRAYLKRHLQPKLRWPLLAKTPAGLAEADAVGACQRAGVPTMDVLAAGVHEDAKATGSFFLSAEVPGGTPADDFWKAETSQSVRDEAIEAMASTAKAFHQADLFHRDFYWCHFFLRRDERSRLVAHLIDLQRVLHSRWLRWRWQVKDLGQFWFSAPAGEVTAEQRRRWFEVYRGVEAKTEAGWRRLAGAAVVGAAAGRAAFYRMKDGRP